LGDLKGSYAPQYDMIIFATKGRHELLLGRPKDIIKIKRVEPNDLIHPAQKPVELILKLLKHSATKDSIVLDPFIGSGTIAVASQLFGCKYIGIEINQNYYSIAIKRTSEQHNQMKLEV